MDMRCYSFNGSEIRYWNKETKKKNIPPNKKSHLLNNKALQNYSRNPVLIYLEESKTEVQSRRVSERNNNDGNQNVNNYSFISMKERNLSHHKLQNKLQHFIHNKVDMKKQRKLMLTKSPR